MRHQELAHKALVVLLLAAGSAATQAASVVLNPILPGSTATAAGADARFLRIDNSWGGSTVLWDEAARKFGQGLPLGADWGNHGSWGTGIWGLKDFDSIVAGSVPVVDSWVGQVATINYGDGCFNSAWGPTWGTVQLAPFFGAGVGCEDGNTDPPGTNQQDNWVSQYSGYIRVTEARDDYNFSVLYDDGFLFKLYGDGGAVESIGMDYLNPRDRLGFGYDFSLSPGLYRFELGAYDRLEAGVVDLRWRTGATDWTLVEPEHLVSVPAPPPLVLLASALAAGLLLRRRREFKGSLPDAA
jgi:hypothetical protein